MLLQCQCSGVRPGQVLGDVFGEAQLDLMQQKSSQALRLVSCPEDTLPVDAGFGERILPQPLAWSLLPLARPPSLISS